MDCLEDDMMSVVPDIDNAHGQCAAEVVLVDRAIMHTGQRRRSL